MKPVTLLFRQTLHRIWRAAGTKYVLVLLAAGIYMIFFDRYNLRSQAEVQEQIQELEKDRQHYQESIETLDYQAEQIKTDRETLERFAREKYHMKRPNEDVFVVVED